MVAVETEEGTGEKCKDRLDRTEEDQGSSGLQGADCLLAHYFLPDLMISHILLLRPHEL